MRHAVVDAGWCVGACGGVAECAVDKIRCAVKPEPPLAQITTCTAVTGPVYSVITGLVRRPSIAHTARRRVARVSLASGSLREQKNTRVSVARPNRQAKRCRGSPCGSKISLARPNRHAKRCRGSPCETRHQCPADACLVALPWRVMPQPRLLERPWQQPSTATEQCWWDRDQPAADHKSCRRSYFWEVQLRH